MSQETAVCKWCKEEISQLQDGGWIGQTGTICIIGSGWHEPSPAVPQAPQIHKCDCWQHEHQVCDICQGIAPAVQTVPIPETQQEWIDFYRKRTADLEAELARAEATIAELRKANTRLKDGLSLIYDKWENGVTCHESVDGQIDEDSSSIGNAFNLSFAEEQEILNLIVDKAEDFEQSCANCQKPYRAHLLHDKNKCTPDTDTAWFPSSIAAALARATGKES